MNTPTTAFDAKLREDAWPSYYLHHGIPAVKAPRWLDEQLGVDHIVERPCDSRLFFVQVKSSLPYGRKHLEASRTFNRFVPLCIGDPDFNEDPDEVLDALEFNGIYTEAGLISDKDRYALEEDATEVMTITRGHWIPSKRIVLDCKQKLAMCRRDL